MSGTPSISHGGGGLSGLSEKPLRTKLNNKIDTLNPLDRLRIADWLIDFKAAAGVEYAIVFNDDYELELLCRGSLGLSISAYPTFAHMEAEFVKWRNENVRAKAAIVYAWLVTNIAWTKDPILAQMVRGSPQNPKKSWDSAQNGQAFFAWLRERGSAAQTHVQQDLEADWAAIYSEAVLAQMGKPRTRVIFQDVSCADSVIDTLTLILSNYEKIEAHATASPLVFIKSMLSLMKDDVVPVQAWAERQLNELVLGEADVPTSRASWLSDNVSRLLHLRLPSRTSTFVSLEQHTADSKATKISGSDVLLALRTQGNAQNYSAPRTANGKPFGNKAAPDAKPSRFEGLCSFCPCRGCNNGPDDPIETCCILGSGEVKPDATADNIGFAESVRGMVNAPVATSVAASVATSTTTAITITTTAVNTAVTIAAAVDARAATAPAVTGALAHRRRGGRRRARSAVASRRPPRCPPRRPPRRPRVVFCILHRQLCITICTVCTVYGVCWFRARLSSRARCYRA